MTKQVYSAVKSLLVAVVVVVLGAIAGYGVGVIVTLNSAAHALRVYAKERAALSDLFPAEAIAVLTQMNQSHLPRCSDMELESFRRLVMEAHFIKDAGRMTGGKLACSANLGRGALPETDFSPTFNGSDGSLIYTGMAPLQVGSLIPIVMRIQDSYVSLDPYPRDAVPAWTRFELTMRNVPAGQSSHLGGGSFAAGSDVLTRTTHGQVGPDLFATECSERYPVCLTAYVPVRQAVFEQRNQVRNWVIAGVILGICCGFVGIFLYKRSKGIEQQLRRAIAREGIHVVYQPLFNMETRALVGAEALVRWKDEDGLVIPPPVFIQIAEEQGFVHLITRRVIHCVLADFAGNLRAYPDFRININIVASDLVDPSFLPRLEEALAGERISASNIAIEITESATARHEAAIESIRKLRQRGHRVYIDDFGTGYSSLAYLKDLAIDGIKIDKAFTHSVGTDSVTTSILPQILAMAKALNLGVVAEGIETEAQYEYYRNTGMALVAQGWLFGHAIPAQEFTAKWLSKTEKPTQHA